MSEIEVLQQRVEALELLTARLESSLTDLEYDMHPERVVFTPKDVKMVRDQSNCSLLEAKQALQRSRGNVEAAIFSLRR